MRSKKAKKCQNIRVLEEVVVVQKRRRECVPKSVEVAMRVGHQSSKTDISISHWVFSRNLKKDEGRPIIVKFVRRKPKIGLMANKKTLKDCKEKNLYQQRQHSVEGAISQSAEIASRYLSCCHL